MKWYLSKHICGMYIVHLEACQRVELLTVYWRWLCQPGLTFTSLVQFENHSVLMFSCCSILIEVINFNNAFSCSLILAPHEFACKPNLSLHNLTAISEWALLYWKVTKYNHRKEPNECHLKQSHIEQKCSKIDKYHFKRNNHEKK